MESPKYETWISDFIKEVSLEELIQMCVVHETRIVWYAEKEDKKMLIHFFVVSDSRILESGVHVLKRAVIQTFFTKVDKYKRIIIYDHAKGLADYTDELEKEYSADSFRAMVMQSQDAVLEKVIESIFKKINKDQRES